MVFVLTLLMVTSETDAWIGLWRWKIKPWWFWQRYWALKILHWG